MTQKQIKFLSEVSLIGFSLVIVSNVDRVLTEDNSASKILLIILILHLFLILTRSLEIPTWIRALGSFLVFLVAELYLFFPSTISNGIPTPESLNEFFEKISDSLNHLLEQQLPITGGENLQIIYALIIFMVVVLSDWTAFTYKKTSETLTPYITLFLLLIYSGERQNSIFDIALMLGAGFVFILLHRLMLYPKSLNSHDPKARSGLAKHHLGAGAALAAIAVSFVVFLGPAIPGARSEALLDILESDQNDSGEPSRILLNPLVNIGNRITENPEAEVFRVKTSNPTYWRLTALNSFDGQIWSSSEDYNPASSSKDEISSGRRTLAVNTVHSFEISNLGGSWAPTAYFPLPSTLQSPDGFLYDSETSSLITKEGELMAGDTYTLTALQLNAEPGEINSISAAKDESELDFQKYTELPKNLSSDIKELAKEITSTGSTDYERALLLQDWFHENFEYSDQVPAGHSESHLVNFLFETQTGFCEQFSGSFAALARSIGIPARVAVGFTPGEYDQSTPDLLIVKAANSHAWPEIYLSNIGWVAFEPTPSRGRSGAQSLNIGGDDIRNIQLAEPGNSNSGQTEASGNETLSPSDQTDTGAESNPETGIPSDNEINPEGENGFGPRGQSEPLPKNSGINTVWLIFFVLTGILSLLYLTGVNLARRRPLMSFTTARGAREIASFVWTAIISDLSHAGIREKSGETKTEFSKRAQKALRLQTKELQTLANVANEAHYGLQPPEAEAMEETIQAAENLHTELGARLAGFRKILKWINPIPAFKIVLIKSRGTAQRLRRKR